MRRVSLVLLALALLASGCCTVAERAIFAVPTLGIYNIACGRMIRNADKKSRSAAAAAEVETCIRQGGDPAACRAAIYPAFGFGVPGAVVNVGR